MALTPNGRNSPVIATNPGSRGASCSVLQDGGLWGRLKALPFVKSTAEVYTTSKQRSALLGTGLTVFERSFCLATTPLLYVATSLAETYPKTASGIETTALECVQFLEDEEPGTKVASRVRQCVRRALKTYPGHKMIQGLNGLIDISVRILNTITPAPPPIPREPTPSIKILMTIPFKTLKIIYTACIVFPVTLWVTVLKKLRRILATLASKEKSRPKKQKIANAMSPAEKKAHIDQRRKVSPRKRFHQSFMSNMVDLALRPFTTIAKAKNREADIIDILKSSKENKEIQGVGKTDKRKYSDMSDEGSDVSEESGFDLDNYLSSEDPDYEPSDAGSTDSYEYKDEDTEDEVESGEVSGSGGFIEIKHEKPQTVEIKNEKDKHNTKQTMEGPGGDAKERHKSNKETSDKPNIDIDKERHKSNKETTEANKSQSIKSPDKIESDLRSSEEGKKKKKFFSGKKSEMKGDSKEHDQKQQTTEANKSQSIKSPDKIESDLRSPEGGKKKKKFFSGKKSEMKGDSKEHDQKQQSVATNGTT